MFNPMRTVELILAMGRLLRAAADVEPHADEYRRGQLLSAYSIARHLAAEEAARAELLEWLRAELVDRLDEAPALAPASAARERIARARDAVEVGDALVDLLDALAEDEADRRLRGLLHGVLAEMGDREVAALAADAAGGTGTYASRPGAGRMTG